MKNSWIPVLLVTCLLSIGSVGCPKRLGEMSIPPCPTPTIETIKSLRDDVIPEPILDYLIDVDMYCGMVDEIRE